MNYQESLQLLKLVGKKALDAQGKPTKYFPIFGKLQRIVEEAFEASLDLDSLKMVKPDSDMQFTFQGMTYKEANQLVKLVSKKALKSDGTPTKYFPIFGQLQKGLDEVFEASLDLDSLEATFE